MTNYFKKIDSSLSVISVKYPSKFTKGIKQFVKSSVNIKEIIIPIGISSRYNKVIKNVNVYNIIIISIYKNLFK
jgi:hypothetical protein